MRTTTLALTVLIAAACDFTSPPARLVAGVSDTVIVNTLRPVRIPMQVLDAKGGLLSDSAVRFQWLSGTPVAVTATGVATCGQPGDATVRASLGPLVTQVLLRCRPVHEVRSTRMMNLVIGGAPQDLPFEAVDSAGRPVTLLAGHVTIRDSTIATVEGIRLSGRSPGSTSLDMRIGDQRAHASVHVYRRVDSITEILPGQHVAMPVTLPAGETRRWRLPAAREGYFVTMIPDRIDRPMPQVAITGAACSPGLDSQSWFCLARQDAVVTLFSSANGRARQESSGMLGVWRQDKQ